MRLAERYPRLVVRLRWLVLPMVGTATWAALTMLPGVATTAGGLSSVIGAGEPAIQAKLDAIRRFGVPCCARWSSTGACSALALSPVRNCSRRCR